MQQVSTQPILDMQFQGLHWIEASAGTGKTFTLSSLMVRILLEKYLPKQVIATTFTRKAAAELKSRIRSRLQQSLQLFNQCRELPETEIQQLATQQSDPLLCFILKAYATQIGYACERLKLVIDQLDELFVGTLDSFSQKLLREFRFESGKIEQAQITDDSPRYIEQLIHDTLRQWMQQQPQALLDAMLNAGYLKASHYYHDLVEQRLNFGSATLQAPQLNDVDLQRMQQLCDQLLTHSYETLLLALQPFYAEQGAYVKQVNGTKFRNGRFQRIFTQSIPAIYTGLAQFGAAYWGNYALAQARDDVQVLVNACAQQQVFKKATDATVQQQFYENEQLQQFLQAMDALFNFMVQLQQQEQYLKYHIAQQVKAALPQLLQQKGETTFSQQIRQLSEALSGEQGAVFARSIHARYPLILVDEFQDTNQDQDNMLAQIWRHSERLQQGCMIMVGDRKQAIYGFRGGDMLTFLKAQQDVTQKAGRHYHLVHNHRSVAPLVTVVDALFQCQPDFGEQVQYTPVQAGPRPHPDLLDQQQVNPTPLRWLQLENKQHEAEQVAWKIQDLLNQAIAGHLYFAENPAKALDVNDIAVLSKNHSALDQVQYALDKMGIAYHRPSKRSVFASDVAQDVAAVLTAILEPYHEAKVRRALLSRLIGLDLTALFELQQQSDGLVQYIAAFDQLREQWLKQGFFAAWQSFLNQFQVWQQLVARSGRQHERRVVNLRHLSELLSQHSAQYSGAQSLYQWYMKQLQQAGQREWELERKLSSEAGVQLLTIHQSKGLEFKIVFLLGADSSFREPNKQLTFSSQQRSDPQSGKVVFERILNIHDKAQDADLAEQDQARAQAEQHRLWYVALTRASYRVYAMMADAKSTSGLAFWRGQGEHCFQHPLSVVEALLRERPIPLKAEQQVSNTVLYAQPLPLQRFYPRSKTSFSYLAQHLPRPHLQDQHALALRPQGQADDEQSNVVFAQTWVDATPAVEQTALHWIQANFPKGTVAGNFLHEIMEQIDFQDQRLWQQDLERRFKNHYPQLWQTLVSHYLRDFSNQQQPNQQLNQEHLDQERPDQEQKSKAELLAAMQQWLHRVVHTPLLQGFCLKDLPAAHYRSEFPFHLALSDRVFPLQRIQQLFAEYGLEMPTFQDAQTARYLNGSIDLLFYDGQRYHIADYKSNFLGQTWQDYHATAVQANMTHASYWLQAALYLVALHRYLKVHLQGYQMQRDLGGASYLYLRGMNGEAAQGYYNWAAPHELILRLDAILGYFNQQQLST
ncbi:UvrD-helicase domain-containing protein [Acinetobacter larvae]|uniref:RecBCD enzyme subunit RecB n=1 Tax=Acinetobacter larvae TaxID=1789224 RepID=A0A1B2LW46_9GAMM|nr:UvrD-helicase domain-containing protein [Acinetobacter larvae]AOA57171.1 exonuclease V subunit beta [Acinetobacter larvae]